MEPAPADKALRPRRVKKRWVIPLALLGIVVVALLGLSIRGTWADTTPKDPKTAAEGILTQLYQTPDGHKQARAAVVLDEPPEAVRAVILDFGNYNQIFRYVSQLSATTDPADGAYQLKGVAHSSLWGDWPFEARVFAAKAAEGGDLIHWDNPGDPIAVNRGSWHIKPLDGNRTLLVYSLEIEVKPYPTFFVRNLVLDRIGTIVADVQAAVQKRRPAL